MSDAEDETVPKVGFQSRPFPQAYDRATRHDQADGEERGGRQIGIEGTTEQPVDEFGE